jgi:hypothetical protein
MSLSSAIDANNPNVIYRGKFYPDLIPFGHPPAQQGLGSVLQVNSSAFIPNTTTKQDATDFDTLGCVKIETGTVGQGNNLALEIGEAGDILKILGATTKGSIIVGNGLKSEELPVGANGLVLKCNSATGTGLEWGTDASGGTVMAVNAGTNISVGGTIAQPIVNFATPTTADILIGTTQQIIAKDNYATPNYTMSIDATGLNDTYLSGGVENKEDISVTATSVQDTISTTNTTDYINSSVLTCDTGFVNEVKTSQVITSGLEKSAGVSITCNTSSSNPLAQIGCGVSVPTSIPFPDITANVSMGCSDATNGFLSITQSAPFLPSYSTTLDKDGLVQNNSTGTGFNLQSAQNIALTVPSANVINITNGNNIEFLDPTATGYTTTISKQGIDTNYFVAGSVSSNADLTNNAGNAELLLSASNLATSNAHLLRLEVPQSGDALIEHTTTGTPLRNLTLSTQGQLTATAGSAGFSISGSAGCSVAGNSVGTLLASGVNEVYRTTGVSNITTPAFIFQNENASNASYPAIKIDRPVPASVAGDTIGTISMWADDATGGTGREWSRIQTVAQNVSAGNQDSTISIFGSLNGVLGEVFNFNGNQNENNSFRPLDMNNQEIRSNTGDLTLSATASTGTGNINLNPKLVTGNVVVNSANITIPNSANGVRLGTAPQTTNYDVNKITMTNTTENKTIVVDNSLSAGNAVVKLLNIDGTASQESSINNSIFTQNLTLTNTNTSGNKKEISITNGASGGASSIVFTNQIDTSNLLIEGTDTGLLLVAPSTTAGRGNITTTSAGNTTLATTGVGSFVEFKPEATAGKVVFTGASLQSNTAGGNSGEHLVITLNGSVYKIKLELP